MKKIKINHINICYDINTNIRYSCSNFCEVELFMKNEEMFKNLTTN